jgi:hypothetical protein
MGSMSGTVSDQRGSPVSHVRRVTTGQSDRCVARYDRRLCEVRHFDFGANLQFAPPHAPRLNCNVSAKSVAPVPRACQLSHPNERTT